MGPAETAEQSWARLEVPWQACIRQAVTSFGARGLPVGAAVTDASGIVATGRNRRPGHRKTGIAHHLLRGAVQFAEESGAPAIEGYPLDNKGQRIDSTMAYVGTVGLFETAGFVKASDTKSALDGFPRVLMRWSFRHRS